MASAGAVSIRTFVPADFDQCINLFADGMNYYSQSNGYEGLRGPVCARLSRCGLPAAAVAGLLGLTQPVCAQYLGWRAGYIKKGIETDLSIEGYGGAEAGMTAVRS